VPKTSKAGIRPGAGALALALVLLLLVLPSLAEGQFVRDEDHPNGPYPGYWSWPQIVDKLLEYQQAHPNMVKVQPVGRTHEGREILVVLITSDVETDDPDKPEVLYMAGIHPREQPPQVMIMQFMDELVNGYGVDERITRLIDTRQIWIMPIYNVDGKVYDFVNGNGETRGANQRLNRQPFDNGRTGVDLNRNGLVGWGSASDVPGAQTYHGPGPVSAPESQTLYRFMASRRFRIFLDIHSALESWILPGHLVQEHAENYRRLVQGMRLRQRETYGGNPRMTETQSPPNSGTGAGQTHVTGFYAHGAYSMVFEVGPTGNPARFYPTPEQILNHYERNVRETLYFLLEEAGNLPERSDGDFALHDFALSGPLTPGARVELTPEVEGDVAYGVLVSRDGAIRVTGEYRLHPLTAGGHVLNVSDEVAPGTEVPLRLYLWDREHRRSVVDLTVTIAGER
jgi:hypothetical protein